MVTNGQIYDFLCEKFPPYLALDFDNVGFILGSKSDEVSGAITALDCDINTVNFAKETNSNLIITHHPVIFDPIKTVTEDDLVYKIIKSGISVICMHTNMDIAKGGVNDCLLKALTLKEIKSFETSDGFTIRSGIFGGDADTLAQEIKQKLNCNVRYTGSGIIKKVLVCSGSGGEYLNDAVTGGFDALITGECKHHHFINAINCGIALFDCSHYASENVIVKPLTKLLKTNFKDVSFNEFNNTFIKYL